MESEKVKEIKKALECWQESVMLSTDENYISHRVSNREILDYINELESENEILHRDFVVKAYDKLRAESKQLKDRIAELEKENATKTDTITDLLKKQEFYETEKLKQFAERLKEKAKNLKLGSVEVHNFLWVNDIDETLKEFVDD